MARRHKGRPVDGILVLDKPVGSGSNEVLQTVKRIYDARKAGHTGSLDRLASGLLPICLGEATKISGYLLNADKRYLTTVKLGERSSTGDAEGEVIESRTVEDYPDALIESVLGAFRGPVEQVPPMHSAIKQKGQRLYKLAHQGVTVEREPRTVTIHALELVGRGADTLELDVHCSKGTYIRTLAEDIGERLGCGARVERLRRVAAGPFTAGEMITLDALREAAASGHEAIDALLRPMDGAVAQWPRVDLPGRVAYFLRRGQPVLVPHAPTRGLVRIYAEPARFLGVGEVLDDGRIAPRRLLAAK